MNRLISIHNQLEAFHAKKKPMSHSSSRHVPSRYSLQNGYSYQKVAPALFGIAGLTSVTAAELGLEAASLLAPAFTKSGNLSITSDKAQRLLSPQARQKMGNIPKTTYTHSVLYINFTRPLVDNADALIEITWEGNAYGEIGAAYVRRNLKNTTSFPKSSLNVSFTKLDRIPPTDMKDPREWPVVFAYDGTYDPYGNGQFEFQGEFEINAFGGLKFNRHEAKSVSAIEFMISSSAYDIVKKQSNRSYTVPALPADQKKYLLTQIQNP